jgi:hypothetical protein
VTAAPRRDDPCVARLAVRWMRPPPRRATVSRRRPTERRTDRGRHLTVARWSGAAGILGSLLLIGVFILVAVFVGTEPAEPEGLLTGFPEVRTAHILENTVYLASIALWVVHALALYQALRRRRPAAALVGAGLTILGLAMLAAGALPHLWQTPISALYHAPGTTVDERTVLVSSGRRRKGSSARCSSRGSCSSPPATSPSG